MIEFVTVGAGAKVGTVPQTVGVPGMSLHNILVDIAQLIEHKHLELDVAGLNPATDHQTLNLIAKVTGDYKSGELLIPESLTTHIQLTECDNRRTPSKLIPNNHAPDAVTSLFYVINKREIENG